MRYYLRDAGEVYKGNVSFRNVEIATPHTTNAGTRLAVLTVREDFSQLNIVTETGGRCRV